MADWKVISPVKTVKLRQSIEQLETIAGIQQGFEELKGLTRLLLVSLHEKCSKNVEFQVEIAPVGEVEGDRAQSVVSIAKIDEWDRIRVNG